ncbi:FUSC family protein [Thalassobacillus hwangdonensis]|uniref:FUSC family protein n=1 Tax=Thalassobacillus hwangdonensis TaxID=546108 RepID=A0ABW3L139_9BACI
MKEQLYKRYWLGRLFASDPGQKRLSQAGKATLSLISSVFAVLLLLQDAALTPAIVSGMTAMLSIMAVMDDTKKEKQVTTLLMGISAACGVTVGSLLASSAYLVSSAMVVIIFSAFYFTRFGSRYFSLGMIGFMTVYISSFLKLSPAQFPLFYLGIAIGVTFAFIYNFIIFKDSAEMLRRGMRSFHIQGNLTFQILLEMINDPEIDEGRKRKLDYNVSKLKEYASNVATDLNSHDVREVWPGLSTGQLRLYVFDTSMLVETLADSLEQLKRDEAFKADEIRQLIIHTITALRNAKVLAPEYEKENLSAARDAIAELNKMITEQYKQDKEEDGHIYLLRRIESIAEHVTYGALAIQQSLQSRNAISVKEENEEDADNEEEEESSEMKPSTKKAFQALIAGAISVVVGHIISPIQPYWVILTTFIVLLGTESVGHTYRKGFQRSIGTVAGAIIGFGLAKLVSGQPTLEVTLIFIVIFSAFYMLAVSYTIMSVFITILIAFMYDLILGGISFELLGARVIDTIAGAIIALLVSAVIFPTRTRDKVTEAFTSYLEELEAYVVTYMESFRESKGIKELAYNAFELDDKVQAIKDQSQPLLNRPGIFKHMELPKWITIFTAINYYAKHLVASPYQKHFNYPEELDGVFGSIEEKFKHNIHLLIKKMQGVVTEETLYDLNAEREQVERYNPEGGRLQGDLIHHLYYVWKINQSLLALNNRLHKAKK